MRFKHNRVKDFLIMFGVLMAAVFISLAFQHIFDVEEQITDLFIFAVFLTALWTDGYICGIITACIGMLAVNFAFTSPFFVFSFSEPENILSAVVMFVISILTSTFTSQLKVAGFASLYILFAGMEEMKKRNLYISCGIILSFSIVAYVLNILLNSNYMFLMRGDGTPYDILYNLVSGHVLWYPLGVVILFILYIALFYRIYWRIRGKRA